MARNEYTHTLTVTGRGQFPIDMLRYDACWPMTQADTCAIEQDTDKREVTVTRLGHSMYLFTVDRWQSFGWKPTSHKRNSVEMGVV